MNAESQSNYAIRHATMDDLPVILSLRDQAREIMRSYGNTFQWPDGYPPQEKFEDDIKQGYSYVMTDDYGSIVGTFALIPGPDVTYKVIYDGQWIDDEPYYVIHRIASTPESHGILDAILDFSEAISPNIRIDTHEANIIMRKGLEKRHYQYCGIIHLLNGDERQAFQKKRARQLLFSLLFIIVFLLTGCGKTEDVSDVDYRQSMRDFIIRISETAHAKNADFIVIPQNGIQLVTTGEDADSELSTAFLAAIDGHGQEDLYYGYEDDDEPTTSSETEWLLAYLRRSHKEGKSILVTDYCSRQEYVANAHVRCDAEGFVSFVAPSRELDVIPSEVPPHENANDIVKLSDAKNFLYLINPELFSSKDEFIASVCATNYDVVIMDLFFNDGTAFTAKEVSQLQHKANGGKRLVICYLSIGEAEDYRYYWQSSWSDQAPDWLDKENPDWPGNYKVRYWLSSWQDLICGSNDSYLNRIIDAHFDGVYLDIVDAFEYYEEIGDNN